MFLFGVMKSETIESKAKVASLTCRYEGKIMDKATEMGKTSTVGSVQLFLGTSISTVIRAVGAIILGLFILPGDYGLYAVALIPAATLSLFQDWGIGSALTKILC